MTKHEFIKRLEALDSDQVESLLPYLEADLAAVDQLESLKAQIDAGRRSAQAEPLEDADTVYKRARKSLS